MNGITALVLQHGKRDLLVKLLESLGEDQLDSMVANCFKKEKKIELAPEPKPEFVTKEGYALYANEYPTANQIDIYLRVVGKCNIKDHLPTIMEVVNILRYYFPIDGSNDKRTEYDWMVKAIKKIREETLFSLFVSKSFVTYTENDPEWLYSW